MPSKSELSSIRRAAARRRWDGPHVDTARLHITLPGDLAKALRAAAKRSGVSASDVVAQAVATALGFPAPDAAPALRPPDETEIRSAVRTLYEAFCR